MWKKWKKWTTKTFQSWVGGQNHQKWIFLLVPVQIRTGEFPKEAWKSFFLHFSFIIIFLTCHSIEFGLFIYFFGKNSSFTKMRDQWKTSINLKVIQIDLIFLYSFFWNHSPWFCQPSMTSTLCAELWESNEVGHKHLGGHCTPKGDVNNVKGS
jgi:hypothetical protein